MVCAKEANHLVNLCLPSQRMTILARYYEVEMSWCMKIFVCNNFPHWWLLLLKLMPANHSV